MSVLHHHSTRRRKYAGAALAGSLLLFSAARAATFEAPDPDFRGRVNAAENPVVAGAEITLNGQAFKPGQEVTISYDGNTLLKSTADGEGRFSGKIRVPADAQPGQHPLVVAASKPSAATVLPLKVSPVVPLSGQDRFTVREQKLVAGLYQAAYSAKSDRVYVTAASGRPPDSRSVLLKINPQTLAIEQESAAGGIGNRAFSVFGLTVDDTNGTIWATNTRDNTVAVYNQSDLKLVKQFEPGAAQHARDVAVDGSVGRAYVSETGTPNIAVFDTKTLAPRARIALQSAARGEGFSPISLELDAANHRLYTVSMTTNELAIINTSTDAVEKVLPIPGARGASGIAFDPRTKRAFIASQASDNLVILNVENGQVVKNVLVGAGPLNAAFDPANNLVYVSNRASGTVTVVSVDGDIVANLDGGSFPNHVVENGKGSVFAINKARGAEDSRGDRITSITPRR